MKESLQEKSKFLSYILRHKPETASLTLDKEGWCSIEQLMSNTVFTIEEIELIVSTDSKSRYSIRYSEGSAREPTHIRANQGHSTSMVKLTFKKAIPPVILYHGADTAHLASIMKSGLLPMKRHHVHLSADVKTASQVGSRRKTGFTILEIDAKSMLADGLQFFISENGVWLAEHVPSKYLKART